MIDTLPVIVYVEDDPDTFKLAQLRLKTRYRLVWAQSDREACHLFKTLEGRMTAVLMDISLHGSTLDGLDLIRVLRGTHPGPLPSYAADVPTSEVPVLVLTAFATAEADADGKALGVTQFLPKPIDFARLNLGLAQANIRSVMDRLKGIGDDSAATPGPTRGGNL